MIKNGVRAAASDVNAELAYKYWRARCFREGSPEEDLFRAICANSSNSTPVKPRSASPRRSSGAKRK
jgi:hypothetical protein